MAYAYDLLTQLYENEIKYTETIYESVGLVDEVKAFLRLNANKALANLGFPPMFQESECQANPAVLRAMRSDSKSVHDFFSIEGASYFMPVFEDTQDSDWLFSDEDDRLKVYA